MKALIPSARWAAIRLFAMDVDGILTDGIVEIHSDGTESKRFSILDGMGLVQLRKHGIETAWISGRASDATIVRASELRIPHLVQGRIDKITALKELAATLNFRADQIVYMGDDNIDTAAIEWAGIGVSVPDAMPEPFAAADYITHRPAGRGAVREVCEHILAARGHNSTPTA